MAFLAPTSAPPATPVSASTVSLDGDLQSVLDEAQLAHVGGQKIRACLLAQIPQASLDERQSLGDEILIGHAARPRRGRRYSRRIGRTSKYSLRAVTSKWMR